MHTLYYTPCTHHAKSLRFQELAADLAEITYEFPFRIPPYSALIIRAISVLEGIALVGNPQFAIIDEAYPYLSKKLLTDDSPRMREALRYASCMRTPASSCILLPVRPSSSPSPPLPLLLSLPSRLLLLSQVHGLRREQDLRRRPRH